jgi:UPF0176 protein
MNTILLFYKYIDIQHPKHIMKWQQKICSELGFKGRILISHEGINGTLGGTTDNAERYKKIMSEHPLFGDIDFKDSQGGTECFPRLSIKVRPEAVSLGIAYDKLTPRTGGQHLSPQETHKLISANPEDLVIFDARNDYESLIGKFVNAITPDIQNFRELPAYIDNNVEQFKDKQVLMYCTGGIRCERATAYLNEKNIAKKVYQIDGGIHRYTEQYLMVISAEKTMCLITVLQSKLMMIFSVHAHTVKNRVMTIITALMLAAINISFAALHA